MPAAYVELNIGVAESFVLGRCYTLSRSRRCPWVCFPSLVVSYAIPCTTLTLLGINRRILWDKPFLRAKRLEWVLSFPALQLHLEYGKWIDILQLYIIIGWLKAFWVSLQNQMSVLFNGSFALTWEALNTEIYIRNQKGLHWDIGNFKTMSLNAYSLLCLIGILLFLSTL